LVGSGEFGDVLEVLGAVEAAFVVAFAGWSFAGAARGPDADPVFVLAVTAGNGQDVVPAERTGTAPPSFLIGTGTSSIVPSVKCIFSAMRPLAAHSSWLQRPGRRVS
jgi:hypothetical protein